ncbi:MAG: helix-turn-helix transcriptional regulator [bacterium]|nr:helix-turn-helix transcriptional regulator [bacterium]
MEDRLVIAIPYVILFFGGDLLPLLYMRHMLQRYWQRRHDIEFNEAWISTLARFDITPRQAEIAALICQGMSNNDIADDLCISLQTVKTHVHNIFAKTGVRNRVQLTNLFRETRSGPLLP